MARVAATAGPGAPKPPVTRTQTRVVATPNTNKRVAATPARTTTRVTATPARSTSSTSSSRVSSTPSTRSSGGSSSGFSGGSSGSGGDFSGGFSDGGSGGFSGGFEVAAAPIMEDITIPDPLQQEPYKRAKAEMLRARGDFDAQQTLARGQYDANFDDSQRQLGWRAAIPRIGARLAQLGAGNDEAGFDPNAQGSAYGDAYQANQGDFAGRGLFNSGMYAQAVSNLNSNFNDRRNSAMRDQKDWRDTQELNKKNFYGQQDAADAAAQEDAISSIMAQLGVGRDQVTPGRQNIIQRAPSASFV